MQGRGVGLVLVGVCVAVAAVAQDPETVPAKAPVDLLDTRPSYTTILEHNWNTRVPDDVVAAERSDEHFGRLVTTGTAQDLPLSECIALAVEHNTSLQIQRLGPLAASTGIQRTRGAFDVVAFGHANRDRLSTPAISPLTAGSSAGQAGPLQSQFGENLTYDAGVRKTFTSGGNLSLAWTGRRNKASTSIANLLVPQYTSTLGLSLNQPLLRDFGWRSVLLLVYVAENTEAAAYQQYKANLAILIAQVERTYWNLVAAIEQVRVQEQGLALARELLRQNQGKFNVGALPRTAVLEAQSEVARREANLILFQNLETIARDNLRAIVNSPAPGPGAPALALISPADKPTVTPYTIDLEHSLKTALEERPELAAARLSVNSQGLQRVVAENKLLPRLDVIGTLGVNGTSGSRPTTAFGTDVSKCTVSTDGTVSCPPVVVQANPSLDGGYGKALELLYDGRFYNYSAGVSVEVPLGNSQAKADYASANISFEQAKLSLQSLEESVTLEVKRAVSNLDSALKSISARRLARELAEENVRNQQARYDVGLATTKDLLDYQDRLTQAQATEVLSLTEYNTDLAELRRVEGTLLTARNVSVERTPRPGIPWWEEF